MSDVRGVVRTVARAVLAASAITLMFACTAGGSGDRRADDSASSSAGARGPFVVAIAPDAIAAADDIGVDLVGLTNDSLAKIAEQLPGLEKVVRVEISPLRTSPETGVGGVTDPAGEVSIYLTDPNLLEADALRVGLPDTLAHEAHHSVRIRQGPGTGTTLGEKMVSEGLATVFAREVFPDTPLQPWAQALTDDQERDLWAIAQPLLDQPLTYAEYFGWFRGLIPQYEPAPQTIPQWAGYTLGVGLVNAYLSRHPEASAATLVHDSAESIITGSGYSP